MQIFLDINNHYVSYIILVDVYCGEVSKTGKTTTLIVLQVNGVDLVEIAGREVAITNLHSCNGPEFVL
ncbi:hypothetical protein Patl1_34994 [Pistacia atlantica]|uniref:Uncharacterized protein n=1 Tax=Pistacia atlantica TaxID=434234 RepID=A0ACC0ZU72_9ROSI|nr:hypothetical protein Patl1_34994 [Pistacia atlantica]